MTTKTKKEVTKKEEVAVPEFDEIQFPKLRLIQFGVLEQDLINDLPMHNRNVSEVAKAGKYNFKSLNVIQSERNSMVYYTYTFVLERE